MTRLTQEQIREAWSQAFDTLEPVQSAMLTFAHRIAALAVQEVEREREAAIAKAYPVPSERPLGASHAILDLHEQLVIARQAVKRAKGAENLIARENATLTAQLAERDASSKANEGSLIRAIEHERARAERAEAQLAEVTKERDSAVGFYRIQAEESFAEVNRLRAQLATAKREALTRLIAALESHTIGRHPLAIRCWRDREYPAIDPDSGSTCKPDCSRVGYCAPGEGCHATPSGEGVRRWTCDKCGQGGTKWEGCSLGECHAIVPVELKRRATPSPEAREVRQEEWTMAVQMRIGEKWIPASDIRVAGTPADAKRIVAMGTEVSRG